MTAVHLAADKPFFAQWAGRGSRARTLHSARRLQELLGFTPPPSLAVVGSKGKGTAAAAASMALASAGLQTVSITSPPFRTNRERIRLNGAAIPMADYEALSEHLTELLPLLPPEHYLSPSGAFTMIGAWWAATIGADVLVVEEGMGGATDEVSLFDHTAVAVTPIFMEHAGILGNNIGDIAANLLGAGSASVRLLGSAPQPSSAQAVIDDSAASWGAEIVTAGPAAHLNPLIGMNIGLGHAVGATFAELLGGLVAPLRELNLPGRSSLHEGPSGQWFVDAAISPAGVAAALQSSPLKDPTILASWPLSKDRAGCSELVPGAVHVRVTGLEYPPGLPTFAEIAGELEEDVVVLGTISFVAQVLHHLQAPTDLW